VDTTITDPVLNRPYDESSRYFELGPKGPTGRILAGRRPSESFIPIVPVNKRARKGA
jgi:type III restriction enzyme